MTMWLRAACKKYQQRARCRGQRALKCRKKSFLDEPRDMIAAMRRNNGDAVFQHVEDDDKAFVEWRSAMHSVGAQRRCRNMVRSLAVANARSGFGLLPVQTEHPEQRRRVKQDKQRDVERRTCRDMAREDHKGRRLRKIA